MACGFAKPCYAAGVDRSFLPELSPPFPEEDPGAPSVWLNRIRQVTGSSYSVVRKVEGIKLVLHLPPFLVPFCTHLSKNFFRIFLAANILLEYSLGYILVFDLLLRRNFLYGQALHTVEPKTAALRRSQAGVQALGQQAA